MKKRNNKKGFFITLEGSEGSGKSTAINVMRDYFKNKGIEAEFTREPGGTQIAETIREIFLAKNMKEKMHEDTELLLAFAARAQHIACVIKPALNMDKLLISDRFTDSSFAYQGGGHCIPSTRIETLEKFVDETIKPDLTILFNVSAKIGLQRIKQERKTQDRFETEKIQFFQRVNEVYLSRALRFSDRFRVIDANQSLEYVHKSLIELLNNEPKLIKFLSK